MFMVVYKGIPISFYSFWLEFNISSSLDFVLLIINDKLNEKLTFYGKGKLIS